ncbi:BRISC and BRCA1-A complex member 2-like isoform X2 [Tripterygium wilfordii]|uniref:BRISC and BRCA1-A complex member 2-like isoform X2 n=1 Tax=Tripterygium wilfordii TaxID=458696 RepID=UPI0018F81FB8|nr:BRISC and BRCA1-A complex member 2-like isoform X2 [Tripterygium wilfordii]XP_038703588.1 BRISC and BRCA1-A complex member 2-like isoform X2 [Tripterygium wilfordii]
MSVDGFPPFIAAQLHYHLNQCPHSTKVDQVWSGSKYLPGLYDRFTLLIPYCLDFIRWDFIYNAEFPMAAPDVIFGPEDEDFYPLSATSGGRGPFLKSLQDWSHKDPTRLLVLIQELRDHYVAYQRKRVGEVDDDRLKFEISTIESRQGIEMHMSSGAGKPEEVKFAVPLLDMNINKLVLGCPWRHQQKIYLQVIYPVIRKYMTAPSAPRLKLMSNPELKALFLVDDAKLPSWVEGMCMAEYLPHLEETLEKQVLEAASLVDVRRRFIEALAPLFGRPVEADSVFCRKATFLAASGAFTFLVHFLVSTLFPKQQPSMLLQSTLHFSNHGVPVKSPLLTDYPWSPRWDASQMAEQILNLFSFIPAHRFCLSYFLPVTSWQTSP